MIRKNFYEEDLYNKEKISLLEKYRKKGILYLTENKEYFIVENFDFSIVEKIELDEKCLIEEYFLLVSKFSYFTSIYTSCRSNKKLKFLHSEIGYFINIMLGKDYKDLTYLSFSNKKEISVSGSFYNKRVDINIDDNNVFEIKSPLNNIKQNQNNMFESSFGCTMNLVTSKKNVYQLFLLPEHTFYKNKDGIIEGIEDLSSDNIDKYYKLNKKCLEDYLKYKEIKEFHNKNISIDNNIFNDIIDKYYSYIDEQKIGFCSYITIIYNHGEKKYLEECLSKKTKFMPEKINPNKFKLSNLEFLDGNSEIKNYCKSFPELFLNFINMVKNND